MGVIPWDFTLHLGESSKDTSKLTKKKKDTFPREKSSMVTIVV